MSETKTVIISAEKVKEIWSKSRPKLAIL